MWGGFGIIVCCQDKVRTDDYCARQPMEPGTSTHVYQYCPGQIIAVRSWDGIMRTPRATVAQWCERETQGQRGERTLRDRKLSKAGLRSEQAEWLCAWPGHRPSIGMCVGGDQGAAGQSPRPSPGPWCYKNPISFAASGSTDRATISICSSPDVRRCKESEVGDRCAREE